MNESKIKDILQMSLIPASDAFTRELMERVERKKSQVKALHNAIIIVGILGAVLLLIVTRIPVDIGLFSLKIKLPSLFVKVIVALFVFIVLNKMLFLKRELVRGG